MQKLEKPGIKLEKIIQKHKSNAKWKKSRTKLGFCAITGKFWP